MFDGTEDYSLVESTHSFHTPLPDAISVNLGGIQMSSHFELLKSGTLSNGQFRKSDHIYFKDDTHETINDFKNWVVEQYNAGTPLTVYYELTEPTYESITLPQLSKYYDDYNIFAHDEYGITEVTY